MKTTRGGKSDLLAGSTSDALKNLTPGTTPYIQALMESMIHREPFTDINEIEPPPPDSDYLRAKELVGCWVMITSIESLDWQTFPGRKKRSLTVTYNIYVYGRPELGARLLSLANRYAVEQARMFEEHRSQLPAMFEIAIRHDPENSQYDAIWLVPINPVNTPRRYYHKPWREEPESDGFIDGTIEEPDSGL